MTWEGLNRRKAPRVQFPCMVKVFCKEGSSEAFLAHTENISGAGVCLTLKKAMELYSSVILEIDLLDGGEHVVCEGKTVWSSRRKAGEAVKASFYDTGVEFVNLGVENALRITQVVDHFLRQQQKEKV